ncbi:cadherin domain protein, partial [Opisthorchis viverrini]
MEEEKPVGFLIGLLLKQLPDAILTSAGTLMFRSIDQEDARFFIVGVKDGRVQVAQRIDREALCPYTEVVVQISETSKPNVPIYSVSAVDSDLGPLYSKLIYEIDSYAPEIIKTTFRIDPETGSIFLQRPLNHRRQTTYDIPVTVRNPVQFVHNSGIPDALTLNIDYRFMDRMQVRVHVASTSDQKLTISVFTPEGGEIITLPEHVSDLPFDFAVVSVTTEKVHLNSYINCTLEHSGIKQFKLTEISTSKQSSHQMIAVSSENVPNPTPVELIYKLSALHSFDREITNTVPLKIQCHDAGNPPLTSEYVIQVHIKDKNDHSPQFNKTKWRFAVNEDSDPGRQRIGYMIAQINAVDLDAGQNAQITYHITEETHGSHFVVDNITGTVRSKGNLDRETFDHHQFTLLAIDSGTPPLTGSTVVTVFVRDYNDEAPVFAQQMYTFHIEENNGYGELIGSLHATDMDEGSNAAIDFSLELMLSPSKLRTFYAQSTTPPVTSGELPFDLVSYFDTLHNTYEVRLYASKMIDREAVAPSSLFSPEKPPPLGVFAPSGTTQLSTGTTKPSPTFKFWVVGEDGGVPRRRGQTMIHVFVDDVNDQHPVFQVPRNTSSLISLSYMEKTGHGVFQVSAIDADAGLNGTVRYFLQSIYLHNQTLNPQKRDNSTSDLQVLDNPANTDHVERYSSLFNIHETTGVIFLVNELTEADIGKLFSVELVARDMGTPISLRSTIILLIRIDDSAPIGNINNQLYNLLGNRPEQSFAPNGGSYLNFYIILSILFVSGFISILLMSVMCFVLRKRRTGNAQSIPALESNGSVEIPMRSAQLWVTHKQGIDSPVKTLKPMSRSNSRVVRELSSETTNN